MNDDKDREKLIQELALLETQLKAVDSANPLNLFHPQDYQKLFFESKKHSQWIFGGNQSGKTTSGVVKDLIQLLPVKFVPEHLRTYKIMDPPVMGRITCEDFTQGVEKILLPKIYEWCPRAAIKDYSVKYRTMYFVEGSELEFLTYEQDIKKHAGVKRKLIHYDEEPPREIWKENRMRQLAEDGYEFGTLTPDKGMSWIYDEIYEKQNSDPHLDIFDTYFMHNNKYLSQDAIKRLTRGFTKRELEVKKFGRFIEMAGLVYPFRREVHVCKPYEIPKNYTRYMAIDPHPNTPVHCLWIAISPIGRKIWYDEFVGEENMGVRDIAREIRLKEGNDSVRVRFIDKRYGNTENKINNINSIKNQFASPEHRIYFQDANDSFESGNNLIKESLLTTYIDGTPDTVVFDTLVESIYQFRHYVWDTYRFRTEKRDAKNTPRKKRDHLMDCAKFIYNANPRYIDPGLLDSARSNLYTRDYSGMGVITGVRT